MINKILISTGGSGGHVIPATILYEHLSKKNELFTLYSKSHLSKLRNRSLIEFK